MDFKLSRVWVRALSEFGGSVEKHPIVSLLTFMIVASLLAGAAMMLMTSAPPVVGQTDGVGPPLGGIGTGGFTIDPDDGTFRRVAIYGNPFDMDFSFNSNSYLAFWSPSGANQLTSASDIASYDAIYPKTNITYNTGDSNISLSLEAFSPIIPYDEMSSCLPLAIFRFRLTNSGGSPTAGIGKSPVKGPSCGGTPARSCPSEGRVSGTRSKPSCSKAFE